MRARSPRWNRRTRSRFGHSRPSVARATAQRLLHGCAHSNSLGAARQAALLRRRPTSSRRFDSFRFPQDVLRVSVHQRTAQQHTKCEPLQRLSRSRSASPAREWSIAYPPTPTPARKPADFFSPHRWRCVRSDGKEPSRRSMERRIVARASAEFRWLALPGIHCIQVSLLPREPLVRSSKQLFSRKL